MATIQNPRDLRLQAAQERFVAPTIPIEQLPPEVGGAVEAVTGIKIEATGNQFLFSGPGVADPSSITMTAILANVSGTASWSVVEGDATLTGTGNSRTVTAVSISGQRIRVRASLTVGTKIYIADHVITALGVDYYLELLHEKITGSQLHPDLVRPIELVTADASVAGSVAARIAAESTARALEMLELANSLEYWGDEIGDVEKRGQIALAKEAAKRAAALLAEQSERMAQYEQVAGDLTAEAQARATSILQTKNALSARIDALNTEIASILGTQAYAAGSTYALGDLVTYDGKIYRALATTTGNLPTNTNYWEKVGDYSSIGEAVGALSAAVTDMTTTVADHAQRLTAVEAESADSAASVVTLTDATADLATQYTGLKATSESHTSSITNLNRVAADNTQTLQAQDTRIGETESSVTTMGQTLEGHAEQLELVEARAGDALNRVMTVELANLEYAYQLMELRSVLGENDTVITVTRKTLVGHAQQLTRLAVRMDGVQSTYTQLLDVSAAHAARLESVEFQSGDSATKVADLIEATAEYAQRFTALENNTGDMSAGLQALLRTQEGQASSITELTASLEDTDGKAAAAADAAQAASNLAGGKGEVIYGSTAPAVAKRLEQNLWIDTTDNANTPKRWIGNTWVAVTDKAATDAAAAAEAARVLASKKADASALQSLTGRVEENEGNIEATAEQLVLLDTAVKHPVTGLSATASIATQAKTEAGVVGGDLAAAAVMLSAMMVSEGDADGALTEQRRVTARLAQQARMLSVKLDNAQALIVSEQQASIERDEVLAEDLLLLHTAVNDPVSGMAATAQVLSTLTSTVNNSASGLPSKASSESVTQLSNQINNESTGLPSKASSEALQSLQSTVENATNGLPSKASSTSVTALADEIHSTTSGLPAKASTQAFDSLKSQVEDSATGLVATAGRVTTVSSRVDALATVDNAGFEDTTGWGTLPAGFSYSTVSPFSGARSLRIDATGTTGDRYINNSRHASVSGGQTVRISAMHRSWAAIPDGTFRLAIRFYGSDGAQISFTSAKNGVTTATWQRSEGTLVAPAGAATMRAAVGAGGQTVGSHLVDDVTLQVADSQLVDRVAAVSQDMTTLADQAGHLAAQYTLRVEAGGVVGGFGVSGTASGTEGPRIDFAVRAHVFSISPPAGSSVGTITPFAVQTASQVINGVLIPAGVYMDAAYIKNVQALWARFGTLIAASIQAESISASKISGGSFSGRTFTGGTFSGSSFVGGTIAMGTGGQIGAVGGVGRRFFVDSNGYTHVDTLALWGGIVSNSVASFTATVSAPVLYGNNRSSAGSAIEGMNSGATTRGAVATPTHAFYAYAGGYGPFTGTHDALLAKGAAVSLGDIVVDVSCIARKSVSDTLFAVSPAVGVNNKRAIGVLSRRTRLARQEPAALVVDMEPVYSRDDPERVVRHLSILAPEFDDLADEYDLLAVNAVGEGQISVCGQGGDIEAGDLIVCSDMPGKGMRQADDIMRSYTVAKAREAVVFSGPDDVRLVPCIYLCG